MQNHIADTLEKYISLDLSSEKARFFEHYAASEPSIFHDIAELLHERLITAHVIKSPKIAMERAKSERLANLLQAVYTTPQQGTDIKYDFDRNSISINEIDTADGQKWLKTFGFYYLSKGKLDDSLNEKGKQVFDKYFHKHKSMRSTFMANYALKYAKSDELEARSLEENHADYLYHFTQKELNEEISIICQTTDNKRPHTDVEIILLNRYDDDDFRKTLNDLLKPRNNNDLSNKGLSPKP